MSTPVTPELTGRGDRIVRAAWIPGRGAQVPGWIVLCRVDSSPQPWVTWFMREDDRSTHTGHYFDAVPGSPGTIPMQAIHDFTERVARQG